MDIEHTLSVVLLLAVMAAIAERLVELLKVIKHPWCPGGIFERWKRRYGGDSAEYAQRMGMVTVLVSVAVAGLLGTDLVRMMTQPAETWIPERAPNWSFARVVGIFAAGLAASFGSRTWHDIAEQLMLVKNAKRRFETGESEDVLALDQRRSEAEAAVAQHRAAWFAEYAELTGVSVGFKEIDGVETEQIAVLFEVDKKMSNPARSLPRCVEYGGRSIPADVIATGETELADYRLNPHGPLFAARIPVRLGFGMHRVTRPNRIGTLGLRVNRDNQTFVLTCMHVACPDELTNQTFRVTAPPNRPEMLAASGSGNVLPIGHVVEARFEPERGFDLALVAVNGNVLDEIEAIPGTPTGVRQVSLAHIRARLPVQICGFSSRHQRGRLLDRDVSKIIPYDHGRVLLNHLLRTSKIAIPGDSGAAVVDRDGNVLGLVVATNRRFTYVMPVSPALGALDVTPDLAG